MALAPATRVDALPTHLQRVRGAVLSRVLLRVLDPADPSAPAISLGWLSAHRISLEAYQPQGLDPARASSWWADQLAESEPDSGPLSRVSAAAAQVLVAAGLIEQDIRFGALFASLQEPLRSRRPCVGLLGWLLADRGTGRAAVTAACHELLRDGLAVVENPDDPRAEWVLRVPVPVWDLVETGHLEPASLPPTITIRPRATFPSMDDLIVDEGSAEVAARMPAMVAAGALTAIVVRGMQGAGRTTLLGAVAGTLGLDLLVHEGPPSGADWRIFTALARLADVLPVVRLEPGPGETVALPRLTGAAGALGIVLGRSGGVSGTSLEHAVTVALGPCGSADRRVMWRRSGIESRNSALGDIVDRFLLAPGAIYRTAPLARAAARAAGRTRVGVEDVQTATRTLGRQGLETLATHLEPLPALTVPVLTPSASEELDTLVRRCRNRERLVEAAEGASGGLNRGVRALFTGPSGTGKTLAARHLAGVLRLDLYRVDLAAVVNKYIGETERNLETVLARAEEVDVVLLLDEGDALMARRTDVSNANDRYANLETNFLLQRLETFAGIVIITTNAGGRIDPAFLRRIDVTVDFVPPDADQRWQIWSAHLSPDSSVDPALVMEVARRCALTGGQIRNAALHAALLAIDRGEQVGDRDLLAAIRREYRRTGGSYPLTGVEQAWTQRP